MPDTDDDVLEKNKKFMSFMSRHLIALTCDYESFNRDGSLFYKGTAVISGFVIELNETFFWVTAGHCLRKLDKKISEGVLKITGGEFMDYFGHAAAHFHGVPYTYEVGDGLYFENRELALDFGLIKLDLLKLMAFAQNKNIAIQRENWVHQSRLTFDHYRMIGIPEDQVFPAVHPDGSPSVNIRAMMVAIERLDPSDVENVPSNDWFVGRIHSSVGEVVIEGMSGGPIYGFRRGDEGQLLYYVVALQSWWRPESRTIFGCSVPIFAEGVTNAMREWEVSYGWE